jgi:hypothetical protein
MGLGVLGSKLNLRGQWLVLDNGIEFTKTNSGVDEVFFHTEAVRYSQSPLSTFSIHSAYPSPW